LQKNKSLGALKQNGQPSAVDLRSNGHGLTRAPWTAPCAWRTGPRWTAPFKRRGTRSGPSAQDLTALDVRERGATASTPECGGARQGLTGVGPVRRSRPSSRPRVGAKCSAGVCARDQGVRGAIGPHRRPAPEGGGAATPASLGRRCCARNKGELGGGFCSPRVEEEGELKNEEKAPVEKLSNGGGSGGAPVWSGRGCHGRRGQEPAIARAR
jgi:hypothetical protein